MCLKWGLHSRTSTITKTMSWIEQCSWHKQSINNILLFFYFLAPNFSSIRLSISLLLFQEWPQFPSALQYIWRNETARWKRTDVTMFWNPCETPAQLIASAKCHCFKLWKVPSSESWKWTTISCIVKHWRTFFLPLRAHLSALIASEMYRLSFNMRYYCIKKAWLWQIESCCKAVSKQNHCQSKLTLSSM